MRRSLSCKACRRNEHLTRRTRALTGPTQPRAKDPTVTKLDVGEGNACVETGGLWGNALHVAAADPERFGRIQLGMPYVRCEVRPGNAERIARFYRDVQHAPADVVKNGPGPEAR